MIDDPLPVLMLAGIRDILIDSTPRDLPMFELLMGDGSAFGLALSYAAQLELRGLPHADRIGESLLGSGPLALIPGNNIVHGDGCPSGSQPRGHAPEAVPPP